MLYFDIRSVESHAVVVDEELAADDPIWRPEDPKPERAVRVIGRLSSAGPGRFYWHGRIEGDLVLPCRRCLADARAHVNDDAHLIFAEPEDEDTDDPDVYRLDPRASELDLRPAIREQWLLAAPSFASCREECLGLCPKCGADLNAGPCDCPSVTDSRWEGLRKVGRQTR